ncbi:MAG: hypothetical protein EXS35_12590 [Pedosphaera sp.]|nr:hypothetical protein [Pedosphaera sp.]
MTLANNTMSRSGISAYGDYVAGLQRLAIEPRSAVDWEKRTLAALNGQASTELRRVVALKTRRQFGAFFTGSQLAEKFIACCLAFAKGAVIHDPSLGVGDLLLAAASRLPLRRTVSATLRQWGRQLTGTDLHPEFVRAAKARLILLARQRHGVKASSVTSTSGFFPGIRVADGLTQFTAYERATHLFLNPPFGLVDAPPDCDWAGGRITAAAMFIATALERAKPGMELLAILPDVLRSGSFTAQWRQRIEELADVKLVEPYGIFDDSADVDVFLLRAVRRASSQSLTPHPWTTATNQPTSTIADFFHVHVGRVVPHRDPETGKEHPYIHPRCIPTWKIVRKFSEKRRHEGKVYKPPFVVIRRTSRPGHPYRAAATVIAGKKSVAVENHLIVCEPIDGTLAACKNLMRQLKTEAVNKFLDDRIRCRHLTVGSVAAIPFES